MHPRRTQVAVVALSAAIAGCALAPHGPPPGAAPQSMRLSTYHWAGPTGSDPGPGKGWGAPSSSGPEPLAGAHCTASNDRGSWTLVTPGTMEVVRSAAYLKVTCRRDGYREATLELRCITPRAAGTAKGAYVGMQFAMMTGPGAVVLVPAAVIAATVLGSVALGGAAGAAAAQAVPEPDVCAYGAGADVQVYMDPAG